MARQLTLLDTPPTWRIDEATREAGRRGVAEARASLRAAIGSPTSAKPATGAGQPPSRGRSAA